MRKSIIAAVLITLIYHGVAFSQGRYMSVDGQLRVRAYFKNNTKDFTSTKSDKYREVLQRTRVQFIVRHSSYLQVLAQFQDSRSWGTETETRSDMKNVDLHQGFIEYKPEGKNTYIFRLGRQEMDLGDGRIIGKNDWNNVGRSFDAFRMIMRSVGFRCDIFFSKVAHAPILADNFIYGLYYTKHFGKSMADFYFIGAKEKNGSVLTSNDRLVNNLGFRLDLNSETIQFKSEFVYQIGRVGLTADAAKIGLSAYGLASSLKIKAGKRFYFGGEITLGSGDDDPASGDVKTLQVMYPNLHKFLGPMDLQGWSNAKTMILFFGIKTGKNSDLKFAFNNLEINNTNDYWYDINGSPYTGGLAGENKLIGREFDFTYKKSLVENLFIQIGGSLMFPKGVVLATTGKDDMAVYFYAMTTVSF
ncbi:alginate export family protein [candidate division KSB1 bacterium]